MSQLRFYCVSPKAATARRAQMRSQFDILGMSARLHLVDAIPPDSHLIMGRYGDKRPPADLARRCRVWSCFASHLKAIRTILEESPSASTTEPSTKEASTREGWWEREGAVVMEDDVWLDVEFDRRVREVMANVPADATLVMLSYLWPESSKQLGWAGKDAERRNLCAIQSGVCGTQMYWISNKYAVRALERFDHRFEETSQPEANYHLATSEAITLLSKGLLAHPPLAIERPGPSLLEPEASPNGRCSYWSCWGIRTIADRDPASPVTEPRCVLLCHEWNDNIRALHEELRCELGDDNVLVLWNEQASPLPCPVRPYRHWTYNDAQCRTANPLHFDSCHTRETALVLLHRALKAQRNNPPNNPHNNHIRAPSEASAKTCASNGSKEKAPTAVGPHKTDTKPEKGAIEADGKHPADGKHSSTGHSRLEARRGMWVVEGRGRCEGGRWRQALDALDASEPHADLLAGRPQMKANCPAWEWWQNIHWRSNASAPVPPPSDGKLSRCEIGIMRVSRALLDALDENLGRTSAYGRVFLPSFCTAAGLSVRPIPDQHLGKPFQSEPDASITQADWSTTNDQGGTRLFHPVT